MAGFKGKFEHSIDDKGRVNLPAKLKKYLTPEAADSFVITRGHDLCLYLYPMDTWSKVEDDLKSRLNVNKEEDRLYLRTLLSNSHEVTLDKQSRIMIPEQLLTIANIEGAAVIIGSLDKIEIWSPQTFETYLQRFSDMSYEDVASKVMGGM